MSIRRVTPQDFADIAERLAQTRHRLHASPEIGLVLPKTRDILLEVLSQMNLDSIDTTVGQDKLTGIVVTVKGNRPGRCIALRADMDALPMGEKTGCEYASLDASRMHACGHDGHMTVLLAVLEKISADRDFAGTLVAVFQPGEEGYAGARVMCGDGLVQKYGIEEFYSLHGDPSVPVGSVAFIDGFVSGNADVFEIGIEGTGGHGSRPHLVKDPVVAMGETIGALQTIASRSTEPGKAAVVSICYAVAGNRAGTNIVPQKAVIGGTSRSYEPEVQDLIESRMKKICEGIALMHEVKVECRYTRLYPSVYNEPERTAFARRVCEDVLGREKVEDFHRIPEGEDFAFMLQKAPGCMFRLGLKDENHTANLHNDHFDFNDRAICVGAATLLSIALARMAL